MAMAATLGLSGNGIEAAFSQEGARLAWSNFASLEDAHAWTDRQFEFFRWGHAGIMLNGRTISTRSRGKPLSAKRDSAMIGGGA